MASFAIHLAVANAYLLNNKIANKKEFYQGIVDPDLVMDKDISHFTGKRTSNSLEEHFKTKVNLVNYLKGNKIYSDYEKGIFLHLITDFKFFNEFFESSQYKDNSYQDFCEQLYYSYDITNKQLEKQTKLPQNCREITDLIENDLKTNFNQIKKQETKNILPIEKLNNFIDEFSNINLNDYANQILKNVEKK